MVIPYDDLFKNYISNHSLAVGSPVPPRRLNDRIPACEGMTIYIIAFLSRG
jgi:hypothetical protein